VNDVELLAHNGQSKQFGRVFGIFL